MAPTASPACCGHLLRAGVGAVGLYPDGRRAERQRRQHLLHDRRHQPATAIPAYNFDDYLIPNCNCSHRPQLHGDHAERLAPTVTNLAGNTAAGGHGLRSRSLPSGSNEQLTLVSLHRAGLILQRLHRLPAGDLSAGDRELRRGDHTLYGHDPEQLLPDRLRLRPGDRPVGAEPEQRCVRPGQRQHPLSCRGSLTSPSTTAAPRLPRPRRRATPRRRRLRRQLAAPTLTDSATLSGGYNPTGTITFYLFAPGVTPNGTDSNNVYSDTVTVSGNGTYTTATGTNPGGYMPTASGHLPVGGRLQRRLQQQRRSRAPSAASPRRSLDARRGGPVRDHRLLAEYTTARPSSTASTAAPRDQPRELAGEQLPEPVRHARI